MHSRSTENDPLYDTRFVRGLFDEMSATYGIVNLISSFGFTVWWRRKCSREIKVEPNSVVVDLMAGMGELCHEISRRLGHEGDLIALDISPAMCRCAEKHAFNHRYRVIEADALDCPLEDCSVDHLFSSFGLKTFDEGQTEKLAEEVLRILRPGGTFAFLEISVPRHVWLRVPYLFYLNRVVPILGRLFLGNPQNYRLLGVYTTAFGSCDAASRTFSDRGLHVEKRSYFFGCATGIVGSKLK